MPLLSSLRIVDDLLFCSCASTQPGMLMIGSPISKVTGGAGGIFNGATCVQEWTSGICTIRMDRTPMSGMLVTVL